MNFTIRYLRPKVYIIHAMILWFMGLVDAQVMRMRFRNRAGTHGVILILNFMNVTWKYILIGFFVPRIKSNFFKT